jgi:glycosyltransferase involved in cell wall biosynthesis
LPETPLVSVIIPVFNRADLIGRAVESVRSQGVDDIEILVVDDGSTDDTADVVRRLAAADARVRLLQQENGGSGAARHTGLQASRGAFIAFLDSDDYWLPGFLERQLGLLQEAPADVVAVVCDGTAVERGKPDVSHFAEVGYEPPADEPAVIDKPRRLWEPYMAPYIQGTIYRGDVLRRVDAFSARLRNSDDFETLVRMSFAGRFIVNPESLFIQDRGMSGQESHNKGTKLKPTFFQARCVAGRYAYEHDTDPELRRRDKEAYLNAYRSYLRALAKDPQGDSVRKHIGGLFACGWHTKSALLGLMLLFGPLGSRSWEAMSRLKQEGSTQQPTPAGGDHA